MKNTLALPVGLLTIAGLSVITGLWYWVWMASVPLAAVLIVLAVVRAIHHGRVPTQSSSEGWGIMRVLITARFLAAYFLLMVALFVVALSFPSFGPFWMAGPILGMIFMGLCALALVDWFARTARLGASRGGDHDRRVYMGERSDVIEIPRTGEKLVFLQRPRDTNGELLEIEFFVRDFALAAARPHIHTNTEERVEVIAGAARMRRGGEEQSLGPGDTLVIPPGMVHFLRREGEEFLHFRLQFRPPSKVETLFETLFGLHRDGKNFRHPLQTVVMAREHDTYLGGPPIWLQRPVIALLAAAGRLLGYRAKYEKYSGPQGE